MKAVIWQGGPRDVRLAEVPDPRIQEPTDAGVRLSTAVIRGSDPVGRFSTRIAALSLFDTGVEVTMGRAPVKCWVESIFPLAEDPAEPSNVRDLATDRLAQDEVAHGYDIFQRKVDCVIKVLPRP